MTSGQPQVCKLWFEVSKGMLPVRLLAPKILMAVNYCGRQLAGRMGWAAPAYHKSDGVGIASSMMGGLMGDLGCGLGCGN